MSWQHRIPPTQPRLPENPRVWVGWSEARGDLNNGMAIGRALSPQPKLVMIDTRAFHLNNSVCAFDPVSYQHRMETITTPDYPHILIDTTIHDYGARLTAKDGRLGPRFHTATDDTLLVRVLFPECDPLFQHDSYSDIIFGLPHQRDNIGLRSAFEHHILESLPTRITPELLASAAQKHRAELAHLDHAKRPLHVVILGERTDKDTVKSAQDMGAFTEQLQALIARHGGSVVLCTSPRTQQPEATVQAITRALPVGVVTDSFCFAPNQPNPYEGLLAIADTLTVTSDSMSMVSDVMACPVPRFVFQRQREAGGMDGQRHYTDHLIEQGHILNLVDGAHLAALPTHMPPINSAPEMAETIRAAWLRKQTLLARHNDDMQLF